MIRNWGRTQLLTVALVTGVGTMVLAQASLNLVLNGKVASTGVIIVNGRAYVPLADVAKAQGMVVVKQAGGYEIKAAGGANQVNGKLQGKIGDELFTGKWGLQVQSVAHVATYASTLAPDPTTTEPAGQNDEIVAIKCRLKNGKQATQAAMLSYVHPHNIALTDNQGQSYAPVTFDKHGGDLDTSGDMLPGSQMNFVVLFSVPKGSTLKDLVFSLQSAYEDTPDGGTDVRVSLTP